MGVLLNIKAVRGKKQHVANKKERSEALRVGEHSRSRLPNIDEDDPDNVVLGVI